MYNIMVSEVLRTSDGPTNPRVRNIAHNLAFLFSTYYIIPL
jgi:hypothetical protein